MPRHELLHGEASQRGGEVVQGGAGSGVRQCSKGGSVPLPVLAGWRQRVSKNAFRRANGVPQTRHAGSRVIPRSGHGHRIPDRQQHIQPLQHLQGALPAHLGGEIAVQQHCGQAVGRHSGTQRRCFSKNTLSWQCSICVFHHACLGMC